MKITHLRQRICAVIFILACLMFWCACSVNWVTEVSGAIAAFGPSVSAFIALLAAFGARIPPSVVTEVSTIETEIQNDLNNVVLPLITQYNQAEADAKPGILGEIQAALATSTANMGKITSALAAAGLSSSDAAKVNAVLQALTVQLNAIAAFLPIVEGDSGSVKAAVKTGNVPMNAEQWATHFNQIVAHATGSPETDASVASVTPIAAPVRA